MRFELAILAYEMIINNVKVLIIGNGANAFQTYYDLSYGFYPHNIIIESVITGGILLTSVLLYLYIKAFNNLLCSIRRLSFHETIFYSILIYIALLRLKSGCIWVSWPLFMMFLTQNMSSYKFIIKNFKLEKAK